MGDVLPLGNALPHGPGHGLARYPPLAEDGWLASASCALRAALAEPR